MKKYKAELELLKAKFEAEKSEVAHYYNRAKAQSVKTIISKGSMFNVLPYETELHGEKRNGKQIPEIIASNNCYIYHFDARDRLIMTEEVSEFLGRPHYFTQYVYTDNSIDVTHWQPDKLINLQHYVLEKGTVKYGYIRFKNNAAYRNYVYDVNLTLEKMDMVYLNDDMTVSMSLEFLFLYNTKGVLERIQRVYGTGGSEWCYSTLKINYKKLEERLLNEFTAVLDAFLVENENSDPLYVFAIDAYTGHGYASLSMNTLESFNSNFADLPAKQIYDVKYESPADWEYAEVGEVQLIDFPLDDNEDDKVLQSIAKTYKALIATPQFGALPKTADFVCMFFNHNGNVLFDNKKVKKILAGIEYFNRNISRDGE